MSKICLAILFFLLVSRQVSAQKILNNFSSQLEEGHVGLQLQKGISPDVHIEQQDGTIQLAYQLGYLIVLDADDDQLGAILNSLSSTYNYVYSLSKLHVFLIPKPFYSTSEDMLYFLDGSLSDNFIIEINDWYNQSIRLDSLITEANKLSKAITTSDGALKVLNSAIESLNIKKQNLITEDAMADRRLRTVGLASGFSTEMSLSGGEDPEIAMRRLLDLIKNINIRHVKDYKSIQYLDPFIKVYEEILTKLDKNKFPYFNSNTVDNPYLHQQLIDAINKINANEKEALTKMGLYPLTIVGAARTPLNQVIQICNNPKVAAGMFSSGHLAGCAADLANKPAVEKNHVELGKLLNKYGMEFIRDEKTRASDPNHIFLSAFKDPQNTQFSKKLMLKMYKALQQSLDDANDVQTMMVDGTIVACNRAKDAIKNINDASKALTDKQQQLEKEIKDLEGKVNSKNQRYADKIKEMAYELAKKDRENGNLDKAREREFFGDRDRGDKGGYWERNTRQEYHDKQNDIHCYREVHENSLGERSVERGCSGKGTKEFSGGKQL